MTIKVLIGVKFEEILLKISNGKQGFPKVWMKCQEIAWFQDFAHNTQGLLGALSPQTPCRIERPPLWKFLPTRLQGSSDRGGEFKFLLAHLSRQLNI